MKKSRQLFLMLYLLSIGWIANAQQYTVKGTVKDSQGETLPGVSVLAKGTTNGTITDIDGNFQIVLNPDENQLVFSFVGFETQEISTVGQTELSVVLESTVQGLDEVVVVGYGSVRKSDLTGSVASVKSEDISSVPVSSVDQALQGRASGVRVVQSNGQPGASTTIRIRGASSIMGSSDPLIVVDGFPIAGGLDAINPSDVESMEVLKDASSTSIYGARAANGVIIVTTKKGKAGKFTANIDSYYGIQYQAKKLDLLNSQQFMSIANERAVNDGEDELFFPNPSAIKTNTDWIDELFDPSPVQNHTVSFNGGNERMSMSHSFNYFNQDGILKNSNYVKGTMRNNFQLRVNEWLTISNSLILSRSDRQYVGDGSNRAISEAHIAPPTIPVYDADGNYSVVNGYPFSPGAIDNPMMWVNEYDDRELATRIFDNFAAIFQILPNLSYKFSAGVDYNTGQSSWYKTRKLLDGAPGGKGGRGTFENYTLLNENILNYSKEFSFGKIDAVVGASFEKRRWTNFGASVYGFLDDTQGSNNLGAGESPQPPYSTVGERGIVSYLGRVNYSYKGKYLVSVSTRRDASSVFGSKNRSGSFPSGALGWRMSEEEFMKGYDWISNLKLRVSYGITGNQAVPPYETFTRVVPMESNFGDQMVIGYGPDNIGNDDLKWETTHQTNIGFDFGVYDERFRLTFDYYNKDTKDLLALVALPGSAGIPGSTSIQNIGEMRNRGIEFSIDAGILEGTFKWDASFQLSANRNEVLKLSKGADVAAPKISQLIPSMNILREGEPISIFYGYVNDGLDETGRNKYKDLDGVEGITEEDKTIIGDPHPDFTFGFNNTFTYKNLSLNVFIDGAQGMDVLWASKMTMQNSFARGGNQIVDVYNDHWTPTNTSAGNPIISADNDFLPADDFIQDASYIKIRSINLAYRFNTNSISWLSNAQVYVNAQNFFTFTNYQGYDPEVNSFPGGDLRLGVDKDAYPSTKTLTMGVRLSF